RVVEREAAIAPGEPRHLLALEDAALTRSRAVEVGLHRCRDRARPEEAPPRVGVREAGIRQVDPSGHVELPALPRVAACRALGALGGTTGHLACEARDFDHGAQHATRAQAGWR